MDMIHDRPTADAERDEVRFLHPDDRSLWVSMKPQNEGPITERDHKTFKSIKTAIDARFKIENKERFFKFLKRSLKVTAAEDESLALVSATTFIQRTKNFGPFRKEGESCVFINQMQGLMKAMSRRGNTLVSPFAGHMSQEEAEERLLQDNIEEETYLVRFSESLADQGGFSLAVKANATEVRHYNILGDPRAAAVSTPYNARLKIVHRAYNSLNGDEAESSDIVAFMKNRLDDEIEDNIYCTNICPNLPFNALFRGYD